MSDEKQDSGPVGQETVAAIDLFAGAGGMSLGLGQAGIDVMAAFDNWRPAVQTYRSNFDHPLWDDDLGELGPDDLRERLPAGRHVDLVVGGPPCQGFSIQRIGGDLDARNELVLKFAELATSLRPRLILMENVPGLLGKRGREIAKAFESRLASAGYVCQPHRLNAADYGVAQLRRRIVYAAWPAGEKHFALPSPTHWPGTYVTVAEAFSGLAEPPLDLSAPPDDRLHRRTRLSELNLRRLAHIPAGGGFESLPVELRVACHRNGPERIGHRNVYGRLAPDFPAGTITARFDSFTRGRFAHPTENRNITLREGARLQSFPDGHAFVGTQEEVAALIGNAVPPLFGRALGLACRAYLEGGTASSPKRTSGLAAFESAA